MDENANAGPLYGGINYPTNSSAKASFITSPIDLDHVDVSLSGMYGNDVHNHQDLSIQLAEKERDLIIAAELGKALLQRNQELSQHNERLQDEYSTRLEILEQEKHALRMRLEMAEAEYDSKVLEIQTEVTCLRSRLNDQQHAAKSSNRENSVIVEELTEQNQRLTQQLKQASKTEEQLSQQLQSLREQFNLRRVALHEHIQQLESLREEIQMLTEKKIDLEKRISNLTEERDNLAENLDEVTLKGIMLERHNREAEQQLRRKELELEDTKRENSSLRTQLEDMQRFAVAHPQQTDLNATHNSLFNELEMADHDIAEEINSPLCGSQQHGTMRAAFSFHTEFDEDLIDDDNFECEDDFRPPLEEDVHVQDMNFYAKLHNTDDEGTFHLKQEILRVYKQLRAVVQPGDRYYDMLGGSDDKSQALLEASFIQSDVLQAVLRELKGLMEDIVTKELEMAKRVKEAEEARMVTEQQTNSVKAHLDSVKEQLSYCKQKLEAMALQLDQRDTEVRKKNEELSELNNRMTLQRTELGNLLQERNQLKSDREVIQLTTEDALTKAWTERDQAVEKKNTVELELTKAQIEMMTLDSQLMEAIQQKIKLSQQLEQWQTDMAIVIESQVKSNLKAEQREKQQRLELKEAQAQAQQNGLLGALFRKSNSIGSNLGKCDRDAINNNLDNPK